MNKRSNAYNVANPLDDDDDIFQRRRKIDLSKSLSQWKTQIVMIPVLAMVVVMIALLQQPADDNRLHPAERQLEDESGELSVNVTFESILLTVIFLLCAWFMSAAFQAVGLPSLVGEIVTGFALGPPLLDLCPYPEAMVLIGSFGLIGLVLDSGIHLDIAQLKETGTRAVFLAASGTILALATGVGIGRIDEESGFRSSMAVGAAFAPSSLGVSSQVLAAGQALNTPTGQLIIASSVVDDVLGLILLSLLEVLVMDSPTAFDWALPFLSSFGYMIVLGYLGVTWIPRILQNHVLVRIPSSKRDGVAFALLFVLLAAYLPLLDYSGASYLTGAFLAGLSFSQLPSVQASYANTSREIMVWLMRIFFAATIGFQIPVRYFDDPSVLLWGAKFLVPVLAKIPLGLLVPRFQRDWPEDFPFDPYWRDVLIMSLSMLCRGEFNFIVASYGLTVGLLSPNQYASIVFAVLVSCVCAPLALSTVLNYYNSRAKAYMEGAHPVQQIGNTNDGTRPLFLAIQARTPVHWGLQERFQHALVDKAGLSLIDHRTWHTLGPNPVLITEIFAQDNRVRVTVSKCFGDEKEIAPSSGTSDSAESSEVSTEEMNGGKSSNSVATAKSVVVVDETDPSRTEEASDVPSDAAATLSNSVMIRQREDEMIQQRQQEIREVMITCLGDGVDPADYVIQVSQWETSVFDTGDKSTVDSVLPRRKSHRLSIAAIPLRRSHEPSEATPPQRRRLSRHPAFSFLSHADSSLDDAENGDVEIDQQRNVYVAGVEEEQHNRRRFFSNDMHTSVGDGARHDPHLDHVDLWETDEVCHACARTGYFSESPVPGIPSISGGSPAVPVSVDTSDLERPTTGAAAASPRRNHRRTRTIDNSHLLSGPNHELETQTIRGRLHGYVRP